MRWSPETIRGQLLRAIMLTSGLVLLVAATALVAYEWVTLRRSMAEHLSSLAQALAQNCAGPLAFQNPKEAEQVLGSVKGEPHLQTAALYDLNGKTFAALRNGPEAVPAVAAWTGARFGPGLLEVFQPVERAGNRLGTLYLASDLKTLSQRMRIYGLIAFGVAAGSLLLGFLVSERLQRTISTPVLALAQAARTVRQRSDYSVRVQKLGGRELGLLTEAFNQMLDEIQSRQIELRRLTDELEQRVGQRTAELAAANRELEAFGYSVSHDLRAPLRHITSYIKLLIQDAGPNLDANSREDLQTMDAAATRMGALIDDLLSLSRLGRATMVEQAVDLAKLVESARKELEPAAADRAVEWHVGSLPRVKADPNLMRSVFVNLLSNALKYTRPRNPAVIEIGSTMQGNELVCHVRDNGVGFEMEFVDKLFGVFQRLHAAEDFEGTGIGLASVRRIVQRHGGRTWAESQVERGATFYFSLPRERIL